jgi:uncharacterized protein (DUF885 family)
MAPFNSLVDDFLANEYELSPVAASNLGLTHYDDRLDDLSAEAFGRRDADALEWLTRFETAANGLSADEEIDRQLAIATLRGRVINADWRAWKRDPTIYSGPILNGLFHLFLDRLRPNAELVDAALARLEQVPRALEQGTANLDAQLAARLIVERGLASARAGRRYVRDMLPGEAATDADRERLRAAGARAGEAFDVYIARLEDLARRAAGDWRYGEERYSRQLRERERLDYDARSLRAVGEREYQRLDAEMSALARRISGTDDWRAVLLEADENHPPSTLSGPSALASSWPTPAWSLCRRARAAPSSRHRSTSGRS